MSYCGCSKRPGLGDSVISTASIAPVQAASTSDGSTDLFGGLAAWGQSIVNAVTGGASTVDSTTGALTQGGSPVLDALTSPLGLAACAVGIALVVKANRKKV